MVGFEKFYHYFDGFGAPLRIPALKSTAQLFSKVKSDHFSRPARLGSKTIDISAAGAEKLCFPLHILKLPETNQPTT